MKKTRMILFIVHAMLMAFAGSAMGQDGSEYLLWEKTPDYSLFSFAISNDETKIVVTGSYNNDESYVLKAYDILTGNEIFSKPLLTRLTSIARFTSDNKYLLIYNEKSIDFYNPKTYNIVKTFTTGGISFSADNKIFSKTEDDYTFLIYNSDTFETVFEGNLKKPESNEVGSYEAFFTPNGKYLVTNVTTYIEGQYSGRKTFQEIYDAKTFQKLEKNINCLKGYGPFSNNGLCIKTFPKDEKVITQPIGFRIYDYEKDSLIWEQETAYIGSMNFIRNTDYLLTLFQPYINDSEYEKTGNCRIWDLKQNKLKNKFPILSDAGLKLSINSRYLTALSNGISTSTIRMYDFTKIFNDYVSVNQPNKSIVINIIFLSDSNLIKINHIPNDIQKISIYDLSGNLIDTILKGVPPGNYVEYNTSHLAKGMYLVKIDTERDTITKKIILK